LTLASDLALVNVEGTGMIGVPGTAERVFGALRAASVSVVMISQGSSEHSICCVVKAAQAEAGRAALARAFAPEIDAGPDPGRERRNARSACWPRSATAWPARPAWRRACSMPWLAPASTCAPSRKARRSATSRRRSPQAMPPALRAVHAGFWLSPQTISLGVIGPGKVGAALLDQIAQAAPRLAAASNLDLRLRGLASSRRMHAGRGCRRRRPWRERLDAGQACDLDAFAAHVHAAHLPHAVIVDCSASPKVAARYAEWLAAGIHVITPNKQAGAGDLAQYRKPSARRRREAARASATKPRSVPACR
jgi:aspartokinase/homoserine dehydrogenase 1